jgi:hypothetical protein
MTGWWYRVGCDANVLGILFGRLEDRKWRRWVWLWVWVCGVLSIIAEMPT